VGADGVANGDTVAALRAQLLRLGYNMRQLREMLLHQIGKPHMPALAPVYG